MTIDGRVPGTEPIVDDQPLDFACPRCGREAAARFYGPCHDCRAALRAAHDGQGRDVEAPAYEPAMHVTPNAVALKDD